ncbi:hypothetical protein CRUP_032162 [Coryphaenoides rupestris]|nr:hypothetical protein CRUP_032162 [Coryphaenoides rupestris]
MNIGFFSRSFLKVPQSGSESTAVSTALSGDKDMVFRHNIRLQVPACDCGESEAFKSLLYRVNGLEEEVNYLKTQCAQGCCSKAGGVDTSCGGHGTYQADACSCQCDPGWLGPDCSTSACPDDCNDNGRCVDGRCVCHQGYTGPDCGQAACPGDCGDKGRCVDGRCMCHQGYTGPDCGQAACPDDCNDNGRCVDGRCVCQQGYTGPDCGQVACPGDCSDKGRCVDGRCVCFPHFSGEDCGVQRCPNDCIGNGRCVDGRCVCNQGFYGDDCSLGEFEKMEDHERLGYEAPAA